MAEKENAAGEGGVQVPVTLGKKDFKNVAELKKFSRKSVLFINKTNGHAHMLPEDLALSREKSNKGGIMDRTHKDYMKFFSMAVGHDKTIGTKKFMQKNGQVISVDQINLINVNELVEAERIASEKAKKDAK